MYLYDYNPGGVVDYKFNSLDLGFAPAAISGGAVAVYKGNGTTESTAGVTYTHAFDGVTGLHHVRVDTGADGAFYAAGNDFQIVLTAGTVDGVSVAGTVLAQFSIQNRNHALASALATAQAAIAALPTANANADALLDRAAGVETNRTLRQALRLMLAALAGKASGLDTSTAKYRDTNDSKDRITATVDANGNRTAVTLDAS